MKLSRSGTHFVFRSALPYGFNSLLRAWLPALCLLLALGLTPGTASADPNGTIAFDARTLPITAVSSGGVMGGGNFTADMATPQMLAVSLDIDGLLTGATAYAVMKDPYSGIIRDFLQVTVNPRGMRGMGINYFTATATLTKNTTPEGIDLSALGLGLNAESITAITNAGVLVNGQVQTLNGSLINTANDNMPIGMGIGGLTVTVQDIVITPEPSSMLGIGLGALMLAGGLRGRRKRA